MVPGRKGRVAVAGWYNGPVPGGGGRGAGGLQRSRGARSDNYCRILSENKTSGQVSCVSSGNMRSLSMLDLPGTAGAGTEVEEEVGRQVVVDPWLGVKLMTGLRRYYQPGERGGRG